MGNKDLENKKANNEQEVNEGFSGENLPDDYNPAKGKLKQETETDTAGDSKKVDRARNPGGTPDQTQAKSDTENARGVASENEVEKTVENKDRNSDVTPNRYPDSLPDNHTNRGNIELDKD